MIAANVTLSFDKQTTRTVNLLSTPQTFQYRERCGVDHKLTVLVVCLSKLRVKFAAISCMYETVTSKTRMFC